MSIKASFSLKKSQIYGKTHENQHLKRIMLKNRILPFYLFCLKLTFQPVCVYNHIQVYLHKKYYQRKVIPQKRFNANQNATSMSTNPTCIQYRSIMFYLWNGFQSFLGRILICMTVLVYTRMLRAHLAAYCDLSLSLNFK